MDWLNNACFYEIYPQSFKDSNGDGIGDFNGIIEKLDYIKELGCNGIWMNPCFDSPFKDAGYDVRDYKKVAARYGTNEDLERLFVEAHKRGIKILLDLVPGHTSDEHEWFKDSKKAEPGEFKDRYIWTDFWYGEARNLRGIAGMADRNGIYVVNFFASQPALNYGFLNKTEKWQSDVDSPEAIATADAMCDIMKFWLSKGADGFRVDMADSLVKFDDDDKSATCKVWKRIISEVKKEYPDARLVSEWNRPRQSLPAGFDMDFMLNWTGNGYDLLLRDTGSEKPSPIFKKDSKRDINDFLNDYLPQYEDTRESGRYCLITGNHDTDRVSYYLDEDERKVAFAFLLTMPGAPFIYYGDEIGMRYMKELPSKEGGYTRTGSRTPMQWDDSETAGFSTADRSSFYLPIDSDLKGKNAREQMTKEGSLYNTVKEVIALRKANEDLLDNGNLDFVLREQGRREFGFKRGNLLIVVNPSEKACTVDYSDVKIERLSEKKYSIGDVKADKGAIEMGPVSFGVFAIS